MEAELSRHGTAAAHRATEVVAAALSASLGPADRAVRLGADEFLVVAPGTGVEWLAFAAHQISADLAELDDLPYLSVTPALAVMATRSRPLPVDALRVATAWARREGLRVVAC